MAAPPKPLRLALLAAVALVLATAAAVFNPFHDVHRRDAARLLVVTSTLRHALQEAPHDPAMTADAAVRAAIPGLTAHRPKLRVSTTLPLPELRAPAIGIYTRPNPDALEFMVFSPAEGRSFRITPDLEQHAVLGPPGEEWNLVGTVQFPDD